MTAENVEIHARLVEIIEILEAILEELKKGGK